MTNKAKYSFQRYSFIRKITIYSSLILGLLMFLFPLIWMVSTSLKTTGSVQKIPQTWIPSPVEWINYVKIFTDFPLLTYVWNTSWYTGLSVIITAFASSFIAFGFARLKARGSTILFAIVLSTMMLPPQVTMIPQYLLFNKLGWTDSYSPLIIPSVGGSAFLIFLLRQFYMGIPRSLDEAVRMDGGGYFTIYFKIILPLSVPALATAGVMEFMYRWNDLMGPLIYINSPEKYPLSLGLANLTAAYGATPWNLLMAASVVAITPPLLLFFFAQKYFIQGIVVSGSKG